MPWSSRRIEMLMPGPVVRHTEAPTTTVGASFYSTPKYKRPRPSWAGASFSPDHLSTNARTPRRSGAAASVGLELQNEANYSVFDPNDTACE